MDRLNKGDKITVEKMVNGKSVGFYMNPEKPLEPQIFIVNFNENGEVSLIREEATNHNNHDVD